jgi:hypothetical protein
MGFKNLTISTYGKVTKFNIISPPQEFDIARIGIFIGFEN